MPIRRCLGVAFVCLLATGSSACGGSSSNGIASQAPDAIVSAAKQAIDTVTSVHVSGKTTTSGTPTTLDLEIESGKGASGVLSESGVSFHLVSLGQSVYINAGAAFWRRVGGGAVAQLLAGKWLKAPATGDFAALASLTNLNQLLGAALSSHPTLTKAGTSTINGQKVIALQDTAKAGTLYVATTGKPYPVEIVSGGSQGGRLNFDRFNRPVSIAPPANAVDVSQLPH